MLDAPDVIEAFFQLLWRNDREFARHRALQYSAVPKSVAIARVEPFNLHFAEVLCEKSTYLATYLSSDQIIMLFLPLRSVATEGCPIRQGHHGQRYKPT